MSSINSYLSFIGPIPPLSREEEKELIIRAQAGNEAARTKLIKANILYVAKVVKHYSYLDDMEELMAWGCMGLNTAISNFKVDSGYKLITYANWCIRTAILEQARTKSVECKTSLDDSLSNDSENTLSLSEIGNIVGLTKGGVYEAKKKIKKMALSNQNNENLADYLVA